MEIYPSRQGQRAARKATSRPRLTHLGDHRQQGSHALHAAATATVDTTITAATNTDAVACDATDAAATTTTATARTLSTQIGRAHV